MLFVKCTVELDILFHGNQSLKNIYLINLSCIKYNTLMFYT